ncbi:uncharacterized protein LOC134204080 [Armigeres subalbatus]|uniref:uncharacterized protein LOC134204080 n=1 Tax=Armigeres subalbatus TaxID=124917 RepID=UPI002ED182CF
MSFVLTYPSFNWATSITKRVVVSDVSRLFDPLGLVGPVIIQAKIFIQDLWKDNSDWDETLNPEHQAQWQEFRRNLTGLENLTVPRWVGTGGNTKTELHGFCDASNKAYGACFYIRTISETGEVCVRLLTAKSRVAPLDNPKKGNKRLSTPRLELSSAVLLAHLFEKITNSIGIETKCFFWTDSTIVKSQLQYESLWFNGPHWLSSDEHNWPSAPQIDEEDFDPSVLETKSITAALPTLPPNEIFSLKSSYTELLRLTAWIQRFCYNSKTSNRNNRRKGQLTVHELDEALDSLVRVSQLECFQQEVADLSMGKEIRESSKLSPLHPELRKGIICVGGRLRHAQIATRRKHPYILDHQHPFTLLIIAHYHRKLLHGGQQLMISAIRERFWPTSIRNLVRKVIHRCIPCFRAKPKVQDQLMADLPPGESEPLFSISKAVYVCLVTKAVHLELASDLSAQAFIATLKRFSSRRGKPEIIMCDNGTNFVGARRQLEHLRHLFNNQQFQQYVIRHSADEEIQFRFIPARSPNFGGLWESAVKSFKLLFKRTIGSHTLLYDEMLTVLTQMEAVMNSRPLTPLSNDPDDYEALTPGHFLIQRPLTAIPEPDLDGIPENRLAAYQKAQRYTQLLWKKWSQLYLSDLHNRTKWTVRRENIAVGTMVVLKDEKLPPLSWLLGRVTETYAGKDGNIRVVTVKTRDGTYRRAISKSDFVSTVREHSSVILELPPSDQSGNDQLEYDTMEAGMPEIIDDADNTPSEYFCESDVDSDTGFNEIDDNINLVEYLRRWALSFNIRHIAVKELLKILNRRLSKSLPQDPRTLLKTTQR